ncbi:hypothetical protein HPB47_000569 [Ixodes persulcatus]|uniref:Uncharacterized protein n=1 Tax=Ixodes persulcatus TaxID=34615 RepID=A0AC60PRE6_IXOPE|nr:hypothetical protein HPB47_000569 [Ixodes persulcatus]
MLYIFATLSPGCVAEDVLPSLTKSIESKCLCPFEIVAFSSLPLTRHGWTANCSVAGVSRIHHRCWDAARIAALDNMPFHDVI